MLAVLAIGIYFTYSSGIERNLEKVEVKNLKN
jgi:hypothetical protein